MLFARWQTHDRVRDALIAAPPPRRPLTLSRFLRFYAPLACTPLIALLSQPLGAAAISRIPAALANLAVWSPVNGLIFMTRSVGFAFNEVVVSLGGDPRDRPILIRFALALALAMCSLLALIAFTPLGTLWFQQITGLAPELVRLAATALVAGLLLPAASVMQSLHTGLLVRAKRTRAIPQAMALMLLTAGTVLAWGVHSAALPGTRLALLAFTAGAVLQNGWLWLKCREM
jgi:hypothetical protein